jgi:DNA-binding MarR family transcriptional regulator
MSAPDTGEDARLITILEAIELDGTVTQRSLSRQCDAALGSINSFLKRLIRKGYVKVTTLPRNRLKYFLTPSGLALKTQLTYEYVRNSLSFYQQARGRIRQVVGRLLSEKRERIAFYGLGDLAEIAYLTLQEFGKKPVAVFDSGHAGELFFGLSVQGEEETIRSSEGYDALLYTRPNWPSDPVYRGDLPMVHIFDRFPEPGTGYG